LLLLTLLTTTIVSIRTAGSLSVPPMMATSPEPGVRVAGAPSICQFAATLQSPPAGLIQVKLLGCIRSSSHSSRGRNNDRRIGASALTADLRTGRVLRHRNQDAAAIRRSPSERRSAIQWRRQVPGAQTVRRGCLKAGEGLAKRLGPHRPFYSAR